MTATAAVKNDRIGAINMIYLLKSVENLR
jgi:hypothetical protein